MSFQVCLFEPASSGLGHFCMLMVQIGRFEFILFYSIAPYMKEGTSFHEEFCSIYFYSKFRASRLSVRQMTNAVIFVF